MAFHARRSAIALTSLIVLAGILDGALRSRSSEDPFVSELEQDEDAADLFTTSLVLKSHNHRRAYCKHSYQCFSKLVCRKGACTNCLSDMECKETDAKNICYKDKNGHGFCGHKQLFGHFDASDLVIILITFFTTVLSVPTGTGGGGVLVPMFIIIGHFSPHGAIPLSKATIFGGAIANNFINLQRRHPRADRPLVDFRATVLLEPILLLGTVLGVFTNAVSPGWLITTLLVVTLLFVTYRTVLKGISTYKAETAERATEILDISVAATPDERQILMDPLGGRSERSDVEELKIIRNYESRPIWWGQIFILLIAWVTIILSSVLKGGVGVAGVVTCGTPSYWFIVLAPVPIILLITILVGRDLIADNKLKERVGYRFVEGDLRWNGKTVVRYPAFCFFAGFAAGALGIAAGTVLSPVLLELGMTPIIATASSGFMVLFTASSTTTQFLIMGQLDFDYAVFFAFIGLVGAIIGNTAANYLVKKYRKTYFIIFTLAILIGFSVILMGVTGAVREHTAYLEGKSLGFRPLCAQAATE